MRGGLVIARVRLESLRRCEMALGMRVVIEDEGFGMFGGHFVALLLRGCR